MNKTKTIAILSFLLNLSSANSSVKNSLTENVTNLSMEERELLNKLFHNGLIKLNEDGSSYEISPKYVDALIENGEITSEEILLSSDCIGICGETK